MSGHVAVRLVEKNPWIKAIILQCAAAFGVEAEDKRLNESFTKIIKQENNWDHSPVFKILESFSGQVYTFYGEHDEVIPQDIQDRYNRIADQKGQAFILPHATHTLLQPKNKLQEEAMYNIFDLSVEILKK